MADKQPVLLVSASAPLHFVCRPTLPLPALVLVQYTTAFRRDLTFDHHQIIEFLPGDRVYLRQAPIDQPEALHLQQPLGRVLELDQIM